MSFELPDTILFEGMDYATSDHLLANYFEQAGLASPFLPRLPGYHRGYLATWSVESGKLFLVDIQGNVDPKIKVPDDLLEWLFPDASSKAPASWYSGTIRAFRGRRRLLGAPPSSVYDNELSLRIVDGNVVSECHFDNSAIPGKTDDELRQTLPKFLWPERLRKPK